MHGVGYSPAVGRGIESSGHLPLAIRFQVIKDGRLITSNFKVVTFPGGDAYGYKVGLSGYESQIRSFVSSGGSFIKVFEQRPIMLLLLLSGREKQPAIHWPYTQEKIQVPYPILLSGPVIRLPRLILAETR